MTEDNYSTQFNAMKDFNPSLARKINVNIRKIKNIDIAHFSYVALDKSCLPHMINDINRMEITVTLTNSPDKSFTFYAFEVFSKDERYGERRDYFFSKTKKFVESYYKPGNDIVKAFKT